LPNAMTLAAWTVCNREKSWCLIV